MSDKWEAMALGWWHGLQGEVWRDKAGVEHRVADMEPRYCRNVVRFIEQRARLITELAAYGQLIEHGHYVERFGIGEHAELAVEAGFEQEWAEQLSDPVGWLHRQPLVEALEQRGLSEY